MMARTWELFFVVLVAGALGGAVMPVGTWLRWRRQAVPWLQNCPSLSIFVVVLLPIAAGEVAVLFAQEAALPLSRPWRIAAFSVLGLLLIVAGNAVYRDFLTLDVPPFLLNARDDAGRASAAFDLEQRLRDRRLTPEERRELAPAYAKLVAPFRSLTEARRRGNWLIYPVLAQALWGAGTVAVLFWCALVAGFVYDANSNVMVRATTLLTVGFGILAVWFPLRVYSNWYQLAFYRADWVKAQQALWILVPVALAIVFFIFAALAPVITVKVLAGGIGGVVTFLGVAARFKWQPVLQAAAWIAEFLGGLRAPFTLVLYLVVFLVTLYIGVAAIRSTGAG